MNDINQQTTRHDERNLAALAHVSAVLPYIGTIVPVLIWVTRKEKKGGLAFQALQAMMFQISIMVVWAIGFLSYFVAFLGNLMALPFVISESGDINPVYWVVSFIPFIVVVIITLLGFAFIVYGIVGAVSVYHETPFRYLVFGKWAERLVQSRQSLSDH